MASGLIDSLKDLWEISLPWNEFTEGGKHHTTEMNLFSSFIDV